MDGSQPLPQLSDYSGIIFIVDESPERGYEARTLGQSIYTQADTFEALKTRFAAISRMGPALSSSGFTLSRTWSSLLEASARPRGHRARCPLGSLRLRGHPSNRKPHAARS